MDLPSYAGWTLIADRHFRDAFMALESRARKEQQRGQPGRQTQLLAAVLKLVTEVIPTDPKDPKFRLGNTLGERFRSWCRAKFFQRYRLFFRYNSNYQVIVYSWFNAEDNLRKAGASTDPYAVFLRMLNAGKPPTSFEELLRYSAK